MADVTHILDFLKSKGELKDTPDKERKRYNPERESLSRVDWKRLFPNSVNVPDTVESTGPWDGVDDLYNDSLDHDFLGALAGILSNHREPLSKKEIWGDELEGQKKYGHWDR